VILQRFKYNKEYKYVFSRDKYISNPIHKQNYDNCDSIKFRVNYINGKEVTVQSEYKGHIDGYLVRPEWCEEVQDIKWTEY
jgi:hypothetical protein